LKPPPSGRVANTPKAFATTDGEVYTSAVLGNVLYIGGAFTHVITTAGVSVPASHLAALDASTGNPISGWRADTDTQFGAVRALAFSPDNTRLYAGGDFTTVTSTNGAFTRRHLVAVDPATGTVVTGWAPATDNSVRALAVSSSTVYAGGDFLHVNNQNVAKIAAFSSATGTLVPGWSVGVDNQPYAAAPTDGRIQALALSADGSKLYLGGYINRVWHGSSADAVTRPGAAAVSTVDGSVDPTFKPAFIGGAAHSGMNPFQILTERPGHLYVAIGGLRNVLYDVNPITGATRWKDTASNDFQTVALFNRYLYAGGHIHKNVTDAAGTHTAVEAIRVDPDTGLMDTSWTPGLGPVVNNPADPSYFGVWTMSATPAGLYVGGAFLQAGGVPRRYLALYPAV
jgi:hypothetical protein